jgi:hypothetical protein
VPCHCVHSLEKSKKNPFFYASLVGKNVFFFFQVFPAFSFSSNVCVLFISRSGRSRSLADPEGGLPTVEAFQRHELTLLRIEDTLNHDWGSAAGKSGQASG